MCGIAYIQDFGGLPVNNGILNIFDAQRRRGVEGFGLFDGQELNIVRATTEDKILKWLCKYDSSLLLFHHRFPTSTANTKSTAHPFSTKDFFKSQYILVHNGHITNSWGLKFDHEKLGIKYQSVQADGKFNDSEALLWDLALYLEGKQQGLEAIGAMAFICIKLTDGKLDKMYFGRNNNPLNMFRRPEGIVLSSEGKGDPIDANHLYTWNYELKRLTDKFLSMPAYYQQSESYDQVRERVKVPYKSYLEREQSEYEEEDDWDTYPDDKITQEAETLALKYLFKHEGNFDIAYAELEFDYYQIEEDVETKEEWEEMRVYEEAMIAIETDPDWIDEHSVSSLYMALDQDPKEQRQLRLTEGV